MEADGPEALDKPVQFFTGKGGVGKSTVISAVALRAARRGLRPLIVELGAHTSSAHLVGDTPIAYEPTEIMTGVHATRVLFEPALVDYVASRLRLRTVAKLVSRNASLRRLFVAAPGVDEIVTMHRVAQLGTSRSWGPVLVDLESTGNALMFFDLPKVLDVFLEDGPLRQVVDGATRLLGDAERSVVHIVTVPEPLIVRETIDLHRGLSTRDGVHLGHLFINRIPPMWLDENSRVRIRETIRTVANDDLSTGRLRLAEHLIDRWEVAQRCIDGLRHDVPLPTVRLPTRHTPTEQTVAYLCDALDNGGIE
ncbi:MAG: ArsA-related P-loop ATPase [Myxococcota bacterium]